MKKSFILLIFAMIIFCSGMPGTASGQSAADREAIEECLSQFIEHINAQAWERAFDLTYPKLFEIVGKHELISMMENMAQSGIALEIRDVEILDIGEVIEVGSERYSFVTYQSTQYLSMPPATFSTETALEQTLQSLRQSNRNQQVSFDTTRSKFLISGEKSLYAIAPTGTDWFVLENNPDQKAFLEKILPQEVRDAFSK